MIVWMRSSLMKAKARTRIGWIPFGFIDMKSTLQDPRFDAADENSRLIEIKRHERNTARTDRSGGERSSAN